MAAKLIVFIALIGLSLALPGGRFTEDLESAEVKAAFGFAKVQIEASFDSDLLRNYRLIKAETQIVKGKNFYFTYVLETLKCRKSDNKKDCPVMDVLICDAQVYESIDGVRQLVADKCRIPIVQKTNSNGIPGGLVTPDLDSADVKAVFGFAAAQIEASFNNDLVRNYRLLRVQTQVVDGENYFFTYVMEVTKCHRDEKTDKPCPITGVFTCEAQVFESLDGKRQLVSNKCNTPLVKKGMFGGKVDVDVHSESAKKVSNFVFEEVEKTFDDDFERLYKLTKAQRQLVNGLNYFLNYDMQVTDCKKNQDNRKKVCEITNSLTCEATAYSSFDGRMYFLSNKCSEVKLSIFGGRTEESIDSEEIQTVSLFAFDQVEKRFNPGLKHQYRLVKAQSQIVNGVNYYVDFALDMLVCTDETDCIIIETFACEAVVYKPFFGKLEFVSNQCQKTM